jgi:hypothetical protein
MYRPDLSTVETTEEISYRRILYEKLTVAQLDNNF